MEGNSFNENPRENGDFKNASDDDFVIGRGFEIDENSGSDNPKGKGSKHSGGHSLVKTLVWVLCIIIVSVGLAFGVIYAGADYMGIGFGRGTECTVEIEQGIKKLVQEVV